MKLDLTKQLFRIPEWFNLMYPKKHRAVLTQQARAQKYFGDRRKINAVWQHTNPQGFKYIFARYGHRKNETIITLGTVNVPGFIILQNFG